MSKLTGKVEVVTGASKASERLSPSHWPQMYPNPSASMGGGAMPVGKILF